MKFCTSSRKLNHLYILYMVWIGLYSLKVLIPIYQLLAIGNIDLILLKEEDHSITFLIVWNLLYFFSDTFLISSYIFFCLFYHPAFYRPSGSLLLLPLLLPGWCLEEIFHWWFFPALPLSCSQIHSIPASIQNHLPMILIQSVQLHYNGYYDTLLNFWIMKWSVLNILYLHPLSMFTFISYGFTDIDYNSQLYRN